MLSSRRWAGREQSCLFLLPQHRSVQVIASVVMRRPGTIRGGIHWFFLGMVDQGRRLWRLWRMRRGYNARAVWTVRAGTVTMLVSGVNAFGM